jgi:signal transduction histidine kinase
MDTLKRIWFYFSNLGINASLSDKDIRLTRLINKFCFGLLLVICISFIYQAIKHLIISGKILPESILMLISFLPLVLVFVLNAKHKFFAGRIFFIIFPIINTLSWMISSSSQNGQIQYSFLIYTIPIVILFKDMKTQIGLISLTFFAFIIANLIPTYYPPIQLEYTNPFFAIILFGIWLIISFAMLRIYLLELNTAQIKLKLKNEELEELSHISSHDLKEPLRTISNFSQLIRTKHQEEIPDQVSEYLKFIENGIERMNTLLNDLTSYSLLESPEERILSKIDLNQVYNNVCYDLNAIISSKNVDISSGNLPIINAHQGHMNILFQNLISNGIKFQPKKDNHKIKIKIRVNSNKEFHIIEFEDNGIGIEPENAESIFAKFKRLNNNADYQGTGLGLTICKKIVEYYHGSIQVKSKFNFGTKVIIKLMK